MASQTVLTITERARSILSSGSDSLDQAISRAVDEAYENGQDLVEAGEQQLLGEVEVRFQAMAPLMT